MLTDAGWNARQARTVPHPTREGLAVGVIGTDAQAVDLARELIDAFAEAGLETDQVAVPFGGVTIELVAVLIGPKPNRQLMLSPFTGSGPRSSVQAARRSTSIWQSQGTTWFQLAGARDATSCAIQR